MYLEMSKKNYPQILSKSLVLTQLIWHYTSSNIAIQSQSPTQKHQNNPYKIVRTLQKTTEHKANAYTRKKHDRLIHTALFSVSSFSCFSFAPAATAGFYEVTNHGIHIIAEYAISLNHSWIAETHRQHNLDAVVKGRIWRTQLLPSFLPFLTS